MTTRRYLEYRRTLRLLDKTQDRDRAACLGQLAQDLLLTRSGDEPDAGELLDRTAAVLGEMRMAGLLTPSESRAIWDAASACGPGAERETRDTALTVPERAT